MEPRFSKGQIVHLRADPAKTGSVMEILPPTGGAPRYRVFHSPTDIGEYYEDQLAESDILPASSAVLEAVSAGNWVDADIFRARLTASRLSHPLVDNLYAFQAARIHYIPFQFKPLLRFLQADRPRLLIADEVGVGKTIEAGLILKELQTRQHLDSLLVVCPKALVSKWRFEMRRFDEDLRPLTGDTLRYCLRETHLDGVWPPEYSRAIAPLELLRVDENLSGAGGRRPRPGLLTLSPPPSFTITIIDEAHHLRNPGTNSHELARFLCDVSEAVLFLSATPVHLGSANLYTLLNLLRPDLFPDETVFQEMIDPNKYITQAIRHVRGRVPQDSWRGDAASALAAAARTDWGQKVLSGDPRVAQWSARLQQEVGLSDGERVRCVRDLEELHSFAHIMNRTRRRDIGRFTIRDPHTVSVPFTPEQQRFYDSLIDFRREVQSLQYDQRVVRLVTDTLERQAASCLPALVRTLEGFIRTGRFSTDVLSDGADDEDLDVDLPPGLVDRARELRTLAGQLPLEDPKLERLLAIIGRTMADEGPGKVLVFSFFLHTLAYLESNLRGAGHRVALITGRVEDEERERLRERFRLRRDDPEAIDVLLSSEVGCEGLDYEFCDRLVNYDIPWNPMRIEQRIGRIDRFGQAAEKVLIFNFITPGTVEERIFFRCFERLGIFRDTVGDLEEVLGEVVEEITRAALDPSLSPAQAEERARQAADNAIRLVEEQRRMEDEGAALLGLDEAFAQDVDSIRADERFISAGDLRLMIAKFVERPEFGGRITADERQPGIDRLRLNKEGRAALLERVRGLARNDRPTMAFTRWLEGTEPHLLLTFDQTTALERRDVPFVTPIHPLARSAVAHWVSVAEPLVSHLLVVDGGAPVGRYLFVCELWETIALKKEVRLVGFAWNLKRSSPAPEVSSALVRLLSHAKTLDSVAASPGDTVEEAFRHLDDESYKSRLTALDELRERNDALVARKLASLDAYHRNRLDRVSTELTKATEDRIIRMREAERDRIERDYKEKRADIAERQVTDIVSRRVAGGILTIRGEAANDK